MNGTDDMPALESWLRDKALEAHNAPSDNITCDKCKFVKLCDRITRGEGCIAPAFEAAFNEVIAYIQSMRVSQRPHVQGKV